VTVSVLDSFAAKERPRIEAALLESISRMRPPLGAAALYAVRAGGKRVRPLLTVAAYRETGEAALDLEPWRDGRPEEPESIHYVGAAVELIHTYSLLHDDLPSMDDDLMRRGLPTTHLVYGVPVATATGSALQHLAFLALAEAAKDERIAERLPELVRKLAVGAGVEGMAGGQFLDLEAEGRPLASHHLEAIHRMKTAGLLAAACAMGAIAARVPENEVRAISGYGHALGLAFQIVDDLLDVIGDPARTGKSVGADRARGKATYPQTHGEEGARRLAKEAGGEARAALKALAAPAPILDAFIDYVLVRMH
jgi:geranylgeranyl pyrophosphate synthase